MTQAGNTPLHLAVNTGDLEIVDELLEFMGDDKSTCMKVINMQNTVSE
jgi:hypothetical protein